MRTLRRCGAASLALVVILLGTACAIAAPVSEWPFAGLNLHNTRFAATEDLLSPANVAQLDVHWVFSVGQDVSATPALDAEALYLPDWSGFLYKIDRATGAQLWARKIPTYYGGHERTVARTTPALYGDSLILGTQGGRRMDGAHMLAIDKHSGDLIWVTKVDEHPAAVVTQSAVVYANRVYVGISSMEEPFSHDPNYPCCTFRGSVVALDATTGAIIWRTYMAPADYTGNAVWGSTPVVDVNRNSLYVTTGNNYTVPAVVEQCVIDNAGDPNAVRACQAPDNYFDSIVALDLTIGAVKWDTQAIPFDAWTTSPPGPDHDFGQGAMLFTVQKENITKLRGAAEQDLSRHESTTREKKDKDGKKEKKDKKDKKDKNNTHQLLGAGQKSGQFWALNPDTGAVVWVTQVGPGGEYGGLQWGSAVDEQRIYVANANSEGQPWALLDGTTVTSGFWSALDPATGAILWQTADPRGGSDQAAVAVANGVVYACSLDDDGYMYAIDAATGTILWQFASGGSCNAGAAIADGVVYWGSGYEVLTGILGTTINNKFYAFTLQPDASLFPAAQGDLDRAYQPLHNLYLPALAY